MCLRPPWSRARATLLVEDLRRRRARTAAPLEGPAAPRVEGERSAGPSVELVTLAEDVEARSPRLLVAARRWAS